MLSVQVYWGKRLPLHGRVMHSTIRLHRSMLFSQSSKTAPRSPTITNCQQMCDPKPHRWARRRRWCRRRRGTQRWAAPGTPSPAWPLPPAPPGPGYHAARAPPLPAAAHTALSRCACAIQLWVRTASQSRCMLHCCRSHVSGSLWHRWRYELCASQDAR